MITIITALFSFLSSIINWLGILSLITILSGVIIPYTFQDSKDIDSKISIGSFTLLHTTKRNGNIRVTVFHQHKNY